ncbi:hypothetical protein [Streptomyces wuyuanensis]|uniref:Uncharacterized protein n=1 Tax=Streptomyces wuyuanensis TaxID=1196353 RepID=A0A1H0A340_9ACTN|nr:hypothetical protein [Streptomyces wuyuanensis]SDN27641.1 hypothetical protein SAMN05444921_12347 [Streptomyces wuyuanensis]
MTNTDMNSATGTATGTGVLDAALAAAAPHDKDPKKKGKARRRTAKTLAYLALISTGLLVLAEPWLLLPVAALVLAISLWD